MKKILAVVIVVVAIIIICAFIPALKPVFTFLGGSLLSLYKEFFLMDSLKKIIVYAVILLVIGILGFSLSKATKKKTWAVAGGVIDILGVIAGIFANK
ncbi:MAG: hypothetical protein IJ766_00535 [Clostridia bacterium]|nr:hypothetical protein [Clostridia bacterium]